MGTRLMNEPVRLKEEDLSWKYDEASWEAINDWVKQYGDNALPGFAIMFDGFPFE